MPAGASVQFLNAAARNGEDLAADPAGSRRTQKQRRIGHIIRLTEPVDRRMGEHPFLDVVIENKLQRIGASRAVFSLGLRLGKNKNEISLSIKIFFVKYSYTRTRLIVVKIEVN